MFGCMSHVSLVYRCATEHTKYIFWLHVAHFAGISICNKRYENVYFLVAYRTFPWYFDFDVQQNIFSVAYHTIFLVFRWQQNIKVLLLPYNIRFNSHFATFNSRVASGGKRGGHAPLYRQLPVSLQINL